MRAKKQAQGDLSKPEPDWGLFGVRAVLTRAMGRGDRSAGGSWSSPEGPPWSGGLLRFGFLTCTPFAAARGVQLSNE